MGLSYIYTYGTLFRVCVPTSEQQGHEVSYLLLSPQRDLEATRKSDEEVVATRCGHTHSLRRNGGKQPSQEAQLISPCFRSAAGFVSLWLNAVRCRQLGQRDLQGQTEIATE